MSDDRIQLLEDLGAEFTRVAAEAEAEAVRASRRRFGAARRLFRAGSRGRTLAIALGATAALGTSAYAIRETRSSGANAPAPLSDWVVGEANRAPGRPLQPGDVAPVGLGLGAELRQIAETDDVGLYAQRRETERGPVLMFWLGPGLGRGGSVEGWRRQLEEHAVVPLGGAIMSRRRGFLDEEGRAPFFGLTTSAVERVELRYSSGPPLVGETGDGGFVLMVDAWRPLRELVAYDGDGHVLDRVDVSLYDMRYLCGKEPGCPTPFGPPRRR